MSCHSRVAPGCTCRTRIATIPGRHDLGGLPAAGPGSDDAAGLGDYGPATADRSFNLVATRCLADRRAKPLRSAEQPPYRARALRPRNCACERSKWPRLRKAPAPVL